MQHFYAEEKLTLYTVFYSIWPYGRINESELVMQKHLNI
jgi:hypothetical protein